MRYNNKKLEEFNTYARNKNIAIIGLGISNAPLLEYFYRLNSNVVVFDEREMEQIDKNITDKVLSLGIKFHFGKDALKNLNGFDIIFRTPSCLPTKPEIVREVERGAILTSEIEMVIELCPGTVIGVTGSDGKTTTTSLIYEIMKEKGYNCYLGGNIGIPLFTKIKDFTPEDFIILELSSFQLMEMKASPQISVITNISPNHLNVHSSYEEYIEAKKSIFKYQDEDEILVLNYDNEITRDMAKEAKGRVIYFSVKEKLNDGIILDGDIIKICKDRLRKHVLNSKKLVLKGIHNCENVCAAIAATSANVDIETQIRAITNFSGVKHRLEFIKEQDGIKWYNDSIGTSPTRTIAGLNSFDENIILIAGGYDKNLDYKPLATPILENCVAVVLMGQTANKIKMAIEEECYKQKKDIPIYMCDNLEQTILVSKRISKNGDVVLFSPASASFDLFKNFEERGDKFKELVNELV